MINATNIAYKTFSFKTTGHHTKLSVQNLINYSIYWQAKIPQAGEICGVSW